MKAQSTPTASQLLNISLQHHNAGRLTEAAQGYLAILQEDPKHGDALHLLGVVAQQTDRLDMAIELMKMAILQAPSVAHYHHNLGNTHLKNSQPDESIHCYRQAIRLNPNYCEAYNGLGNALILLNELEAAAEAYRNAIRLKPAFDEAHYNLGRVRDRQGRLAEAIVCYQAAIKIEPANPDYHFNLSGLLLLQGNFAEGWQAYEWRWQLYNFPGKSRNFACPRWRGEALNGEKILLYAEQGYGDTLQFVRYAPLVAAACGGEVILEVQPGLQRLLSTIPGISKVITQGDPLPQVAWHCPLMSLPLAFRTSLETIPASLAYLQVPEHEIAETKQQWPAHGLRVGLAWAGDPKNLYNAHRSMHLRQFLPLKNLSGVSFYSLQVGEAAKQIQEVSAQFAIADVCSQYTDFTDTAKFIAGLDLVITVDTAVAHLAGALGIPVWILLPHNRIDWRWLAEREDSPWYPSVRLFRQSKPGDWPEVMERVSRELQKLSNIQPEVH